MSHVRRFDHVGLTVADLDLVTAFFVALGLEVEGRTFVNGQVAVPTGGQVKVPTPRVDQVLFRVVPPFARASRMR